MGVVVEEEGRCNGGRVVPPTGRYGDEGNLVEEVDTTTPRPRLAGGKAPLTR